MTLNELKNSETGKIIRIKSTASLKRRLLDMGFITGTLIKREKCAPLADPVEYVIKNYHVSLRKEEAENIIIEKIEGKQ